MIPNAQRPRVPRRVSFSRSNSSAKSFMAKAIFKCSELIFPEVLGYTIIVLSFLLMFFGIRSYRDNAGNGQITFGKPFRYFSNMSDVFLLSREDPFSSYSAM